MFDLSPPQFSPREQRLVVVVLGAVGLRPDEAPRWQGRLRWEIEGRRQQSTTSDAPMITQYRAVAFTALVSDCLQEG